MDLSTDTLKPFVPTWGSADGWNQAYEKVENYLRACRLNSRLQRARLIHRILERVENRGPLPEGETISAAAIRETQALMESWFCRLLHQPPEGAGHSLVDGRVALLLCDGPERWPFAFLSPHDPPPELAQEMRANMLVAGPNLQISNMVPREIDYGWFPEIAGDTLEHLSRRPVLKAFIVWLLFLLSLAYLFWKTR